MKRARNKFSMRLTSGGRIAASRQVKPGNKMPAFDRLSAEDLRAIAAHMEILQ